MMGFLTMEEGHRRAHKQMDKEMGETKPGEVFHEVNPPYIAIPLEEYKEICRLNITLRDFFAGCALVVLYSHEEYRRQGNNRMASDAFDLADDMMEEREK